MIPKLIRDTFGLWTNGWTIMVIIAVLIVTSMVYISFGWENIDKVGNININLSLLLLIELIVFAGINLGYLGYYVNIEEEKS